ncbi:hypothetical protein MRX96_056808 [Rhipicephalus microplus]
MGLMTHVYLAGHYVMSARSGAVKMRPPPRISEPSTLPPVADTSLPMGLALESEPAIPGDLPDEEHDKGWLVLQVFP